MNTAHGSFGRDYKPQISGHSSNELDRLRREYVDRERRLAGNQIYSPFQSGQLFMLQLRERSVLALLSRHGFNRLDNKRILEIGCGKGEVLLRYLNYGALPKYLNGVELLPDRLKHAQVRLPHLPLICADGQFLPYATGAFDLVLQYTVFSSVLDRQVRVNMAKEMLRVLRKPDGMILWYDFWTNPTNPNTDGMRPKEIRSLFQDCQFEFHRITLAPPVARRLVKLSWLACYLLERLVMLNTHYLVAIRPYAQEQKS